MKIDTEYLEYMWPMRHFLITCGNINDKSNIITISFCMPVSKTPPMIGIALRKESFSYSLIKKYEEFIVNVPSNDLKKAINYCGFNSGYNVDKYKNTGLSSKKSRKLRCPIISECYAHLECIVKNEVKTGDKILFIGEVIESYADEEIINKKRKVDFPLGEFPKKIYGTRF